MFKKYKFCTTNLIKFYKIENDSNLIGKLYIVDYELCENGGHFALVENGIVVHIAKEKSYLEINKGKNEFELNKLGLTLERIKIII